MKNSISTLCISSLFSLLSTVSIAQEPIKVAIIGSISEGLIDYSKPMLRASAVAFTQINEQGGIGNGQMIETIELEGSCDADNTKSAVSQAIHQEKVLGIIGPQCSGPLRGTLENIISDKNIVVITPSASAPLVTGLEDNDQIFRTVPSRSLSASYLANALIKTLHIKTVAVTYFPDPWGADIAAEFEKQFTELGGEVVFNEKHPAGSEDYTDHLKKISEQSPEALFIIDIGSGDGATIMKNATDKNMFPVYFGIDEMRDPLLIERVGNDALSRLFIISNVGESGFGLDKVSSILDADISSAHNAYDASFVLALAIEQAKGDASKVHDALREVSSAPGVKVYPGEWAEAKKLIAEGQDIDYEGAGSIDFDAAGDVNMPKNSYALYKVEGGNFKVFKKL